MAEPRPTTDAAADGDRPYQPQDRRPIKSRNTHWAGMLARRMASAGISPNAISIAGMLAAIAAGLCLALMPDDNEPAFRTMALCAALLVQVRLIANLLDGMVAIERGIASATGELYNDAPDRISDIAILVGAGYAIGGWPVLGYLAALGAMLTAYVRLLGKAVGTPQDFRGPMAKQHRMFLITLAALYLAAVPADWRSPWGSDEQVGVMAVVLIVIIAGCAITAARRLRYITSLLKGRPT